MHIMLENEKFSHMENTSLLPPHNLKSCREPGTRLGKYPLYCGIKTLQAISALLQRVYTCGTVLIQSLESIWERFRTPFTLS